MGKLMHNNILYTSGTSHNYSTTEQIVGTWIDGSTIYERTIEDTFADGALTLSVNLISLNISKLIHIEGFLTSDNSNTVIIGCDDGGGVHFSNAYKTLFEVKRSLATGWGRAPSVTVTIQYTKSSS